MATTSGTTPAGITGGDGGSQYAALVAGDVDIDALLTEHLRVAGAPGILSLATAVNKAPVLEDIHQAVAVVAALETLKSAAQAQQARQVIAYQDSLIAQRLACGTRDKNPAWGSSGDIALALHLSPRRGTELGNDLRLLTHDLPCTLQGLAAGMLTWEQVKVMLGGTRHLRMANRQMVDQLLWEETHTCFGVENAKLREMVNFWALQLEPATEEDLEEKAVKDRYLDMYQFDEHRVRISGMVPLEMGVPMMQVLARHIDQSQGKRDDERNPGQVAVDTLFETMTRLRAGGSVVTGLVLVMDQATLCGDAERPVLLPGAGYISAAKGRRLLAGDLEESVDTWLRRLYVAPGTGELVGMDSRARRFTGNLKLFLTLRDQYCRTPYCN